MKKEHLKVAEGIILNAEKLQKKAEENSASDVFEVYLVESIAKALSDLEEKTWDRAEGAVGEARITPKLDDDVWVKTINNGLDRAIKALNQARKGGEN